MYKSFWLLLSGYLRNKNVGSYSNSRFTILRTFPTVFNVVALTVLSVILEGSHFFKFLSAFIIIFLFDYRLLMSINWYIIVIWVCISLMTNNIEHLLMYLLSFLLSSLMKSLFEFFCPFLSWIICLIEL